LLVLGGKYSDVPGWFTDIEAAKELGCSVFELEERPFYWKDRALIAKSARLKADADLKKSAEKKSNKSKK
jgi:hypothetical protein